MQAIARDNGPISGFAAAVRGGNILPGRLKAVRFPLFPLSLARIPGDAYRGWYARELSSHEREDGRPAGNC